MNGERSRLRELEAHQPLAGNKMIQPRSAILQLETHRGLGRRSLLGGLIAGAAIAGTPASATARLHALSLSPSENSMTQSKPLGSNDFDFFFGDWRVRHSRLKRRLAGDTEWVQFGGDTTTRPILGGLGNMDDNVLELPEGEYEAVTLRLFDPATREWSIRWIDARNPKLEEPVFGRFENGVGLFYGDDVFEGRPIRVRFTWSDITATTCRWAQAFSPDAGATWEENWIMEFTRVPA